MMSLQSRWIDLSCELHDVEEERGRIRARLADLDSQASAIDAQMSQLELQIETEEDDARAITFLPSDDLNRPFQPGWATF